MCGCTFHTLLRRYRLGLFLSCSMCSLTLSHPVKILMVGCCAFVGLSAPGL